METFRAYALKDCPPMFAAGVDISAVVRLVLQTAKKSKRKRGKIMRWMTVKSIQKYSKTPKGALKTSIRHHRQILNATLEELSKGILSGKVSVWSRHCGLCFYYKKNWKQTCPLRHTFCCCDQWATLSARIAIFKANPTKTYHIKVQRAERKLIKRMESLL